MSDRRPRRILILGATSAIAIAVARELISPDARFFLVARNGAKLEAVRRDLLTRGAGGVDRACHGPGRHRLRTRR